MGNKYVDGIEDFKKALDKLEKKLRNKIIRAAMRDGLKIIAKDAKDRAPEDTGAMRDSIKVKSGKRKKDTLSMQVIVEGGHGDSWVPLHIEAGTAKMPAKPFLRPALWDHEQEVRQLVLDKISDAIEGAGK